MDGTHSLVFRRSEALPQSDRSHLLSSCWVHVSSDGIRTELYSLTQRTASRITVTVLGELVCSSVVEMLKCTLARGSPWTLPQISQSRGP